MDGTDLLFEVVDHPVRSRRTGRRRLAYLGRRQDRLHSGRGGGGGGGGWGGGGRGGGGGDGRLFCDGLDVVAEGPGAGYGDEEETQPHLDGRSPKRRRGERPVHTHTCCIYTRCRRGVSLSSNVRLGREQTGRGRDLYVSLVATPFCVPVEWYGKGTGHALRGGNPGAKFNPSPGEKINSSPEKGTRRDELVSLDELIRTTRRENISSATSWCGFCGCLAAAGSCLFLLIFSQLEQTRDRSRKGLHI